jgi:hypothetical protein
MAGSTVDDLYYEVAKPKSLAEKVMIAARDAIYRSYNGFYDNRIPTNRALLHRAS